MTFTPKAGEKVAKDQRTQVGRALEQLGIEHIAADSPEARGRSERAFGTLQDRLPLALAGITTVKAANRFLREVFLPGHNARLRSRPSSRAAGSSATLPASIGTSGACTRSGSSATTTACATAA